MSDRQASRAGRPSEDVVSPAAGPGCAGPPGVAPPPDGRPPPAAAGPSKSPPPPASPVPAPSPSATPPAGPHAADRRIASAAAGGPPRCARRRSWMVHRLSLPLRGAHGGPTPPGVRESGSPSSSSASVVRPSALPCVRASVGRRLPPWHPAYNEELTTRLANARCKGMQCIFEMQQVFFSVRRRGLAGRPRAGTLRGAQGRRSGSSTAGRARAALPRWPMASLRPAWTSANVRVSPRGRNRGS